MTSSAASIPPARGALAFRPLWRFVRSYALRLGFLDGWQGYYIAWMTAFYTATRYAKVLEARQDTAPQSHPAAVKTPAIS